MAYISQEMKAKLAPGIKKVFEKYGVKGTIGVRDYRVLTVKLKSGPFDFGNDYSINPYWVDQYGKATGFVKELIAAMKGDEWYDRSDIMTDYFDTAYYLDIQLGTDSKKYEKTA